MSQQVQIAPSILASDFLHLGEAVRLAEEAGADRLHIDIMDGRFVPNISIGPPVLEAVRSATRIPLEAHLMIIEPERYVPVFVDSGADLVTVHVEASPHLHRTLQQIQNLGARAGVAINPATPWNSVEEVLELADLILVMTVNPGFGGQQFISSTLPKLKRIRDEIDRRNLDTELEVDGGIDLQTVASAVSAGARVLVAGTSVFRAQEGVQAAIAGLRSTAQRALNGTAVVQQ